MIPYTCGLSFPTSVPDDNDEDDGRASPPHRSYLIYTLVHRTGWSTDNVGCRNRRASQTPSSTASGALHRRRLPAHRGYFTEHIVAPPPPEAVGASPTVSSTASQRSVPTQDLHLCVASQCQRITLNGSEVTRTLARRVCPNASPN